MAEGPRTLSAEERKLIADALRRASADARQAASCWDAGGAIAKVVRDPADIDRHKRRFAELAHQQDRLADEIGDQSFDLTLARKTNG